MGLKHLKIIPLTIILFIGCEDKQQNFPDFKVIQTIKGLKSYGAAFVLITIENTGSASGYNVHCKVIAKSKTNILDSGYAYFNLGEEILPGEKYFDEAIFLKIYSHQAYQALEYEINWSSYD